MSASAQGNSAGRRALSFTDLESERPRSGVHWTAGSEQQWERGLIEGRERFAEIRRLAHESPQQARIAIRAAITDPEWGRRVVEGWGAESGFAEALAHAAVAYLTNPRPLASSPMQAQTFRVSRDRRGVYGARS